MNLENFKQAYLQTISESANDSDLKNWIRSIVEEILIEKYTESDLVRKIKSLDAMISPSSGASDGERENAIKLKQILQSRLQDLNQTPDTNKFTDIMKTYGFNMVRDEEDRIVFLNTEKDQIDIYPETNTINLYPYYYLGGKSRKQGTFKNLDTWMSNNTKYPKKIIIDKDNINN